jgi:hypothetical protein
MDRQTVRPRGLINAKSPGRPPKLSKEQMEELGRLVESGPDLWFQDEMRVGQKNSLVYQWAKKGGRERPAAAPQAGPGGDSEL